MSRTRRPPRRATQSPRAQVATTESPPKLAEKWPTFLSWGILVGLLPFVGMTLYGIAKLVSYPYEANFGEGGVLYDAIRLARGEAIYQPAGLAERWLSPYPPLYQWIVSVIGAGSFVAARYISAVAAFTSAACLFILLRYAGVGWGYAGVGAALWLVSPFVNVWAGLARVDMFGRALESLAIVCLVMIRPTGLRWAMALGFAVLAMLTKQSLIAGALTCFGLLWFVDYRKAWGFAGLWSFGTLICYGALALATNGQFLRNVFLDAGRSLELRALFEWLILGFALSHVPQLISAACGTIAAWREARKRVFVVATVAGLPSVLLSAHDGADVNYYFDILWGTCGLATVGLEKLASRRELVPRAAAIALSAGIIASSWLIPMRWPDTRQLNQAQEVQELLKQAPKPVLTEFVAFGLAAGSEPVCVPYLDKKLEERGKWRSSSLVERIRRKEFGAIQLTSQAGNRWSPTILQTIEENYRVSAHFPAMFAAEGEPTFFVLTPAP